MTNIGFDTETWLIEPGCLTPPLVCGSFAVGENTALQLRDGAVAAFTSLLLDPDVNIIIHNAAYDCAVLCNEEPDLLPLVFEAYKSGRIRCTKVREMMIQNAKTGLTDDNGPKIPFDLAAIVQRRFTIDISESKTDPDAWRTRYKELDGVPLDQWPPEAKEYAEADALWHLRVFESQASEEGAYLADEVGQTKAAFVLHLMGVYGVVTDEKAVQDLEAELTVRIEKAQAALANTGILKPKKVKDPVTGLTHMDWAKDTKKIKALVEAALGDATPKTEPSASYPEGQTKTDEETLLSTGNPDLKVLAEVGNDLKVRSVWGDGLKGIDKKGNQRGLRLTDGWLIHPNWSVLVASGRTACWGPPMQQLPRKGNVRPCFVPRPGYWYCSVDYGFIELVTWAQTCLDLFGFSDMAESIKAGRDPHVDMAVEILRASGVETDYDTLNKARKAKETWATDGRQMAKAANFGLPGGLGSATFVKFAKASYDVVLTIEQSENIKAAWRRKWREVEPYFNHVNQLLADNFGDETAVTLPRTGFVRGGCTYCAAANTYFQGLAARGAKEALWNVSEECYLDMTSPLYGSRPVMFIHDEIILEVPAHREVADGAARRLMKVMEDSMRKFTPDVPVTTEPTLMARWYKEAAPVYGEGGVLELWRPKAEKVAA